MMLGAWEEGLAAIRENGISILEEDGQQHTARVIATSDTSDCKPSFVAVVLVKSWQTDRVARQLVECLAPEGIALTLQNGMGNREKLASVLGPERVFLGSTTSGASLLAPGKVRSAGRGIVTLDTNPHLQKVAEILVQAGFPVERVADPTVLLWGKLVINAAINPLTALLRVPNGELLARPTARSLMGAVAWEAAAVAQGQGVNLPYPDPAAAAQQVALRTSANLSSMLQDVMRGAPTEIDAISGALAQAGLQCGVPAPLNHTLWQLVKALSP